MGVRHLLFFSPTAASFCRGPHPQAAGSARRPAPAVPGPGRARALTGSAGVGPEFRVFRPRTLGAGRPGRAGPAEPGRAGPERAQGFECRQEGADAGAPHRGRVGRGSGPLCSHPPGSLRCFVCRCGADPGSSRGLGADAALGGPPGAAWLRPCRASARSTLSQYIVVPCASPRHARS
jgi:hypothetical protein